MKKLLLSALLFLPACATDKESVALFDKGFRAGCDAGSKIASYQSFDKTLIDNRHYKLGWEQGIQVCDIELPG
jgi:hypothetical protein